MVVPASLLNGIDAPPYVKEWIAQLLDPEYLRVLNALPAKGKVDLRLSAANGRAREPMITIGARPGACQDH